MTDPQRSRRGSASKEARRKGWEANVVLTPRDFQGEVQPPVADQVDPEVDEYLVLLQERNEILNRIKNRTNKDNAGKREEGFSVYFSGANDRSRPKKKGRKAPSSQPRPPTGSGILTASQPSSAAGRRGSSPVQSKRQSTRCQEANQGPSAQASGDQAALDDQKLHVGQSSTRRLAVVPGRHAAESKLHDATYDEDVFEPPSTSSSLRNSASASETDASEDWHSHNGPASVNDSLSLVEEDLQLVRQSIASPVSEEELPSPAETRSGDTAGSVGHALHHKTSTPEKDVHLQSLKTNLSTASSAEPVPSKVNSDSEQAAAKADMGTFDTNRVPMAEAVVPRPQTSTVSRPALLDVQLPRAEDGAVHETALLRDGRLHIVVLDTWSEWINSSAWLEAGFCKLHISDVGGHQAAVEPQDVMLNDRPLPAAAVLFQGTGKTTDPKEMWKGKCKRTDGFRLSVRLPVDFIPSHVSVWNYNRPNCETTGVYRAKIVWKNLQWQGVLNKAPGVKSRDFGQQIQLADSRTTLSNDSMSSRPSRAAQADVTTVENDHVDTTVSSRRSLSRDAHDNAAGPAAHPHLSSPAHWLEAIAKTPKRKGLPDGAAISTANESRSRHSDHDLFSSDNDVVASARAASATMRRRLFHQPPRALSAGSNARAQTGSEHSLVQDCSTIPCDEGVFSELPQGEHLRLELQSNWGDEHRIGLAGVQIHDSSGKNVGPRCRVTCKCDGAQHDVPRSLLDGPFDTGDEGCMWSTPITESSTIPTKLDITLPAGTDIAAIRIWNYRGCRIHVSRGVRQIRASLDGKVIFQGRLRPYQVDHEDDDSCAPFGDLIVFTTDDIILQNVAAQDEGLKAEKRHDELNLLRQSIKLDQVFQNRPMHGTFDFPVVRASLDTDVQLADSSFDEDECDDSLDDEDHTEHDLDV